MQITTQAVDQYLALLEATPRRLAACTAGLDAAALARAPGPKAWSVVEHLAHLRGCDEVWSHSVYAMLLHNGPTLPLLHPRDWAKTARYASLDFPASFQAFALKRAEYLRVLRALKPAQWQRPAQIGSHTHTVFSQVRRTALHEAEHCVQIEEVVRGRGGK